MVRADHAAVITYAEPVTAVIFAALFLAERLGWVTAVGGVAVIAAGVLVARLAPSSGVEVGGLAAPPSTEVGSDELESTATKQPGKTDRSRR